MKKIFNILSYVLFSLFFVACSEVDDDGIKTVIWEGSVLPEDSLYRNPVWEPDLSFPSVFKAATSYIAIGVDNEWSPGLFYTTPLLSSNNLMDWELRGEAFSSKPNWVDLPITGVSAAFSKIKGMYYIVYNLGKDQMGMGISKSPSGPYKDYGLLLSATSLGLSECSAPFLYAIGSKAYVFFKGGDGFYGVELNLNKEEIATVKGDIFKIGGEAVTSVAIIKYNNVYYSLATVSQNNDGKIILNQSGDVKGPFTGEENNNLLQNSGSDVIIPLSGGNYNTINHIGGIFDDKYGNFWVFYQVTDLNQPILSSGKDRHPMMLTRIQLDENGKPIKVVEAKGGWNYPKYSL